MSSTEIDRHFPRIKLVALLGIILLAAFLRLYRIDTIPPGDRYDPAYYGVDALQILQGERPVFFPTNFGREALFSYLVALYVALFGATSYAMYVTSAIVGIATIPAVYLLAEELFAEEEGVLHKFGGVLAALTVAISYWHLNWSRFGVRAILVPLVATLTFCFLWRALSTGSRLHFVAAGFFLGLGAYTYQVARLYPVLVVLAFLCVMTRRRRLTRRDLVNLAIVTLVALVVFAPLGAYFLTHPGSFMQRIEQASAVGGSQSVKDNLLVLWHGVVDTLLSFSFQGDLEPTTNLPGRPTLNAFFSVLFFVGVLISLLRIKKAVYLFLIMWLAVMIVPAILSQYGPIAKRAIGTLPAIMMLIAIGALVPWDTANHWAAHHRSKWGTGLTVLVPIVIVLGFVFSTIWTYRDYFVVWAQDPDLFTHFETGPTAIGQYVGTLPPEDRVYVSPIPPDHPSVIYNSQNRPGIKGYDGRACIVVPKQTTADTTYVIVPGEDPNSLDLLHIYFPLGQIVAEGPLHDQQPYFFAFGILQGAKASIAPSHAMEANWGNKIKLLGYDLDADVYKPGDAIQLILYYQALEEMDEDYTVFAHLLGPSNPATPRPLRGQADSQPCQRTYPTTEWTIGEIVRDRFSIAIPGDAPPGDYQLDVGFYLLDTMARLPATDAAGHPLADDAVPLGIIEVRK